MNPYNMLAISYSYGEIFKTNNNKHINILQYALYTHEKETS